MRLRRVAIVGASIAAVGAAAVAPAPASPRVPSRAYLGPVRSWGGTEIRSLDRAPVRRMTATAAASATTTPTTAPKPDVVLSNERTLTRWAYVGELGWIHTRPSQTSPAITSLHWFTEDGFPEIYLVLREHWDAHGQPWVLLRIPMRPNGRTGWVLRSRLSDFHLTRTLVTVNRERLRMYFSQNGRTIWSAPVGVGKPSTPTPAGHFWIRERFTITDRSSGYWPYAFGTSDYSTLSDWPGGGVVGIHGPYFANSSIPGYISHGCIRLHPSDDTWLAWHIQLGTPLHIV